MEFQSVCLAPYKLEEALRAELGSRILEERGRVFLVRGNEPVYFAQNIWLSPQFQEFASISQAAKFLRSIQRNWVLESSNHHRRAQLIADQLPPFKVKRVAPYSDLPNSPLGSWTLWDEKTLLYSAKCSSVFPHGEVEFIEDKVHPPSRAYLKLWEYFLLSRRWPQPGDSVVDLGSSPGGWTWALDQIGCRITSVDKAPLAKELNISSRVTFLNESAFSIEPFAVDWLFSDIICYPNKLFELVEAWLSFAKNVVCTIKFQGETDFQAVKMFSALPHSRLLHLCNNKHELTFAIHHDG